MQKECTYPYLKAMLLKKGLPLLWNALEKILDQNKSSTAASCGVTVMMVFDKDVSYKI